MPSQTLTHSHAWKKGGNWESHSWEMLLLEANIWREKLLKIQILDQILLIIYQEMFAFFQPGTQCSRGFSIQCNNMTDNLPTARSVHSA